ncbi:MAG: hypothetical protein R2761_13600 [Acidimicrobiales bacterium]
MSGSIKLVTEIPGPGSRALVARRAAAVSAGAAHLTELGVDAPHPGGLGGAYSGNPLACVAALTTIAPIDEALTVRAEAVDEVAAAASAPAG